MVGRVERNEVDFGLASCNVSNSSLTLTPLYIDRLRLVCHKEHPLAAIEGPASWKSIAEHNVLSSGVTRSLPGELLPNASHYDFPNIISLTAMLRANMGVTILPSLSAPHRDSGLITRPLQEEVEWPVYLVERRENIRSPAARAMIDTLYRELPAMASQYHLILPDKKG